MYDMGSKEGSQFGTSGQNRKLVIAYDGTGYKGFQIQKDQPTIQGEIESALSRILSEKVRLCGASRTDAGVHALGQVANFSTESSISCEQLQRALNALMPSEIRIRSVEEAPETFHARYSALSKRYQYRIFMGRVVSPFSCRYVFHAPWLLPEDVARMDQAAQRLVGRTDLACFMSVGSPVKDTRREVRTSRFLTRGDEAHYVVEATGFLRHSVRAIVGTLLLVARGRLSEEEFIEIVREGRREASGPPVPARGLCLERVYYAGASNGRDAMDP